MKISDGSRYVSEINLLINEYISSLKSQSLFGNITFDVNDLEEKYLPPNGELLTVLNEKEEIVGCVAYHNLKNNICELKRLYVKPEYRNKGIGNDLVEAIIIKARENGFMEMVLDTGRSLKNAIRLYEAFGFKETDPYYQSPVEDVIYMSLKL